MPREKRWDKDKVVELYGRDMGDRIYKIPIIKEGMMDRLIWFHDPQGLYSSKSSYSWLVLKKIGCGLHKIFWRAMWKLKLPSKVLIVLSRVGHDLLPTLSKIDAFSPLTSLICPKCGEADETLIHALRDYPKARDVLVHGGINGRILSPRWLNGIDWLESTMRLLDKPAFECFMMVLWNLWNTRNNLVFKGKKDEPRVVWDRAAQFFQDFQIHNLYLPTMIPR